ncbi:MAG: septum formation inhibitor Maf [Gammaproteobacteria bacterium]|nr:septum formation inhibitor Maf [Gammaproteobacteria bacterium]MDE2250506.1 septum formation inhibitor Maf [Gammaproteobacteria bacterium]
MPSVSSLPPVLLLASASPRRRELLWQIGVPHRIAPAGIDERRQPGETPADCVRRLALAKADAAWRHELPVLGADTAVVADGEMLGKPATAAEAAAMLARLAGRVHEVLTAVALIGARGRELLLSRSEVRFRELAPAECARYWQSGEARDKAGGYAIQGLAAVFVSELRGSYSGVMGLPLFETAALLDAAGVPRWQIAGAAVAGAAADVAEGAG